MLWFSWCYANLTHSTVSCSLQPWLRPLLPPLVVLRLKRCAIPRRRRMSWSRCWAEVVEVWQEVDLQHWEGAGVSCLRMVEAMYALSMSVVVELSTCVTCGRPFWTCSGATSSSCSQPPLLGPGLLSVCCGTWWRWCTEICWVRRQEAL